MAQPDYQDVLKKVINYSSKNTNKAFSAIDLPISGQVDNNIG